MRLFVAAAGVAGLRDSRGPSTAPQIHQVPSRGQRRQDMAGGRHVEARRARDPTRRELAILCEGGLDGATDRAHEQSSAGFQGRMAIAMAKPQP